MAITGLRGTVINTNSDLPEVGSDAPSFNLVKSDLSNVSSADFAGQRVVLNIFPSIDTPTCAMSVRTFNERAAALENTTVVCISADLPFAAGRFCGTEGIENAITGSTFRDASVLETYGVAMIDGPLAGLAARAVVVVDEDGKVLYTELVSEIPEEPNYDAAIASLG